MKTFVLGDIHGACKALKQCLQRSAFDKESDQLIFLGDVCDRGPETAEAIDLLLEIKNLKAIMGNHDQWLFDWIAGNTLDMEQWQRQGGQPTINSYLNRPDWEETQRRHLEHYFQEILPFYKDVENRVFVHAGFNWQKPIEQTDSSSDYQWNRKLFTKVVQERHRPLLIPPNEPYKEIYLGHSPTIRLLPEIDGTVPVNIGNVWCLDQGAGWGKKLTIMNIATKEYFQSDDVDALY